MPGRGNPNVNLTGSSRLPPIRITKAPRNPFTGRHPMNFSGSSAKSVTSTPPAASTGTGMSFNLGGGGGLLGGYHIGR